MTQAVRYTQKQTHQIVIASLVMALFLMIIASHAHAATTIAAKAPLKKIDHSYLRVFYYRDGKDARASFYANPRSIDVFAPQSYSLDEEGILDGKVNEEVLAFAKRYNMKIMPLVVNKAFRRENAHTLLDDPVKQYRAIQLMVVEAKNRGYWGWQFDFEQLDAAYRDRYSAFLRRAAEVFAQHDLVVSVAVVAQISNDPAAYPRDLWQRVIGVYDYAALASSTDFVSVMTYDDPESKGPVARYSWMKQVIEYSLAHIPKEKLSLGLPFYYWKWDNAREKIVGIGGYEGIKNVLAAYKVKPSYSTVEQAPFIKYTSNKKNYTLWYENARSIEKKIELINQYGLHGFSAWALGLEVPDIHRILQVKK